MWKRFRLWKRRLPPCSWGPFRQWALVAMSCQETLEEILRESLSLGLAPVDKISRPHTHLVNAVHGCCQILENTSPVQDLFVPVHDGFLAPAVDLSEICNIIYWMAHIQAAKKLSIAMLRHWDHRYLPSLVTGPAIREASQKVLSLELCSFRFWNLVDLAERKETDLPAIVNTLNVEDRRRALRHKHHDKCAATKCQYSHKDSTKVDQLHICESDCGRYAFPMDELGEALELGHTTAWSRDVGVVKPPHLHNPDKPYIAISHVWADGTGVGVQQIQGMVNKCLFDYFSGIAKSLGCDGVWWDALSIPLEPKARSKAIATLHKNYSTAEYTVVHDLYLTNMAFKDPATACLAIVLSPWFTRGWTALELRMSTKVVVLFKGPKKDEPVIKDLDADILAKSPGRVSRTHWLASTIISRLRRLEINYIDDILAILRPRSTSWVRDRTVIAALLTQIPNCDFSGSEGAMTRGIILHLGFVP
ncbi:hypothetical protein N7519_007746 [Penicillium mononematosum]|uniref:uncharacterized protein n=1 Tax=Penicillium mononematosum TaxID=268346 RepID=UPI0025493159|nr:uncharacterized protein N7519_007746 [Penicillium mononematosum]KAJ6186445.1 hypothetical protein N7519_007746 [Penicillium mononematosum]